jgi:mono/diheme cytochrome c family protein
MLEDLMKRCRTALGCLCLLAAPAAAAEPVDYARAVKPILTKHCWACHGPAKQKSGLRLDTAAGAIRGGNSGPAVVPGDGRASRLIQAVTGADGVTPMPPKGPRLAAAEIAVLRAWIDQGARAPATEAAAAAARTANRHWSFRPVVRPAVPPVKNTGWVRNAIDRFILARLEREGITPAPQADRATLIRRLSLDLVGLPPTPEEVAHFLNDSRPDAYERVVDRLLSSPRYGEKWARPWLDLAHYADSDGFWDDLPRPYAWRWRQWVIDALNCNLPFDQFTVEQLAGDLLPGATLDQRIATGFLRNTLTNREGGINQEQFRVEQVVDRTSTVATAWLGLTAGCARCHDHKFDPLSQKEFYQLFAFFNSAEEVNLEVPLPGERERHERRRPEYDRQRNDLLKQYRVAELQADWEKHTRDALTNPKAEFRWRHQVILLTFQLDGGVDALRLAPSQRTAKQRDRLTDHFVKWYGEAITKEQSQAIRFVELGRKLQQLEAVYPELSEVPIIANTAKSRRTRLLIRGDFLHPGVEVRPDTPAVLPSLQPNGSPPGGLTRLDLARWLVDPQNPLTGRVTVNRMWQEFFGRGLMATSEDFGTRAAPPTHPALLDWLAAEFVAGGWDVKRLHRLIVTAAAYRQSSRPREELRARDPANRLLARQERLRLPAELIRDDALAVGGWLEPSVGGRSIRPPMPAGGYSRFPWKADQGPERYRRGLYIWFQRTSPYPLLMTFDAPDSQLSCTRRERSNTPLQALDLLNDPMFVEAAQALAGRVLRACPEKVFEDRLSLAFRLCLAREPRPAEAERLHDYYLRQKAILAADPAAVAKLWPGKDAADSADAAAWVGLSSVLLNLDEFITRR